MSVEAIQKIFKTLSDPTRVRILALLEREELAVQDLMEILGMAQSRVSRHLAILREAGLLRDRRDGTFVFYRMAPDPEGDWREAWELVVQARGADATAQRDADALTRHQEARRSRTRAFFDAVGPEWDALRKVFDDATLRARALSRLVSPELHVADVGTGTGILAVELAQLGVSVVAVDHSPRMLDAARAKLEQADVAGVELRAGSVEALPLADGEVDAAFAHMVLHYVPDPEAGIAEMARVVRPGGLVVIVDFERHDREWMREELGVEWLGFPVEDVRSWLAGAGLEAIRIELDHSASTRGELPRAFVASGRRPAGAG